MKRIIVSVKNIYSMLVFLVSKMNVWSRYLIMYKEEILAFGGVIGYPVNNVMYPGNILDNALKVATGSMHFFYTGEQSKGLPSGRFNYSQGFVMRRTENQIFIFIYDYTDGNIATNVYLDGKWNGWKVR